VVAPVQHNCGLVRYDSTNVVAIWAREQNGLVKPYTQWLTISSAGVLGTLRGPLRNVTLASKPYTYGGKFYVNTVYTFALGQ